MPATSTPAEKPPALLALEADWEAWLRALFLHYVSDSGGRPVPFAPHHRDFWTWLWAIERGVRPVPFIGIWSRGGAKSTSAELGAVALGARGRRRYGLYVSGTQDQADDHVGNVAGMLESRAIEQHYPTLADRALGKYGNAKGWRRNRLRTAAAFTIDALGLDVAARGIKLDEQRPDFIVLDDIDSEADSLDMSEKKIRTITRKLLPAGAQDLAVLGIQNMVLPDGFFGRLAKGTADYLRGAIVSGPVPAVEGLQVQQTPNGYRVIGGTPTWEGQPLAVVQQQINEWGYSAFLAEAQHDVDAPPGGMFDHLVWARCPWDAVPWADVLVTTLWVDPAVTKTDRSDAYGIQCDALARDGRVYRLFSWEQRATPTEALTKAILKAVELKASYVGVETDQGGDTWGTLYYNLWRRLQEQGEVPPDVRCPTFTDVKAGAGDESKVHRAQQMLLAYERGTFVHVEGTHETLERALRRFPRTKPFDLTDVAVHSWRHLEKFRQALVTERPQTVALRARTTALDPARYGFDPMKGWR